jgi:hypothetical protein
MMIIRRPTFDDSQCDSETIRRPTTDDSQCDSGTIRRPTPAMVCLYLIFYKFKKTTVSPHNPMIRRTTMGPSEDQPQQWFVYILFFINLKKQQ